MHTSLTIAVTIACIAGVAAAQPFTIETFDDFDALVARKAFSPYPKDTATYAAAEDAAVGDGALAAMMAHEYLVSTR